MDSFGATLSKEREERGLTLDTVAAVIGIDRGSLAALERDEFDRLPDHEAMIVGLRAYADCLQVDAELMIEHYEHERERCLRRLADLVAERAAKIRTVEVPAATVHPPRQGRQPLVVLVFVVLLAIVGLWWAFRGEGTARPAPASTTIENATPRLSEPSPVPSPPTKATPTRLAPTDARQAKRARRATTPPTVGLTIPEYGIGTGVRNRQLVGRNDSFVAGTQVWFWNRVEGGAQGERIEHVWLHEGIEAARIALNIGGPRWRTQSSKTLRSAGAWAVEARDSGGRVLARTEFDCVR